MIIRLTERDADGKINVRDASMALRRLVDYENRLERSDTIMAREEVERVFKSGQWRKEMLNYINDRYDGDFPDWETELNTAISAALAFVEPFFHG